MSFPKWSDLQNANSTSLNNSYMAYVGWQTTAADDENIAYLFSEANLLALREQIANALNGVDPQGRRIHVSLENIASMLSNVYRNSTRARIGDIHSRFIVPQQQSRCDLREINNITVNILVRTIRDQYDTIANNKKLSIWTTVLGDFNEEGLRSHPPLKIRRRHPQYMAFNMNY